MTVNDPEPLKHGGGRVIIIDRLALFRTIRLKPAAASILIILMLVPAKAKDYHAPKGMSVGTAVASVNIQKRIEIRPDSFADSGMSLDNRISDISIRDCNFERKEMIKSCILMIYEIQ
ncbi:MAG: hypothetical protein V7676_01620 [Parasphingorhabdus sp.]|uniref:hypothetical protein n=1 Tax=Parasphingorhabdus sp. TaxID=2709688 RepID=UPI0030012598